VTVHGRQASKRLVPNARAGRDEHEIVWRCGVCRRLIDDGAGYVTVGYTELRAHASGAAEWEVEHPGPCVTAGAFLDYPALVEWQVLHRRCDPNVEGDDYWIDVERLRTPAQLLRWAAHLSEKEWLDRTTWPDVLRAVAKQLEERAA
jgi:hypothetical protein